MSDADRSKEQLLEEVRSLGAQFDGIPAPVFVWRLVDDDFVLVNCNAATRAFSGAARHIGDRVGPVEQAAAEHSVTADMERTLRRCVETGEPVERESSFVVPLPDGSRRTFHFDSRYTFVPPDHVVIHTLDITARREAEQELERYREHLEELVRTRTEELVESNRRLEEELTERAVAEQRRRALEAQIQHAQKLESLGVLAGGIAHDFNNMLMSILGNSDLALRRIPPESPGRTNLRNIETTARRAGELTRQLLAYSGKGRFQVEELDLRVLVQEISHLLQVTLSKKCSVRFDFDDQLPTIQADASQLRQVVMNLITNASEAIGDREGVITVSIGAKQCDLGYLRDTFLADDLAEGRYVHLAVTDTGQGMDEATQQKIFDPFFTTKFTGRGLGLAAVIGIIRGHHGAIKVYSEVGKGTAIRVLFPATGGTDSQRLAAADEADDWQGRGTVLVVDDEAHVIEVVTEMLRTAGFEVLTARDGREAVEIFGSHQDRIACTVLDLMMPRLDGEETFQELRRMQAGAPILLTSGYDEQDVTRRFVGKQLTGFLQKPFTYGELAAALRLIVTAEPNG